MKDMWMITYGGGTIVRMVSTLRLCRFFEEYIGKHWCVYFALFLSWMTLG